MQLHAVIAPPPDVVEDAFEAAREMLAPAAAAADASGKGILGRLRGRRRTDSHATPAVSLAAARPEAVFVSLAKFGNVTATDATVLGEAIAALSRTWAAPLLHVSGIRVAEASPFDVTAQLDGDVDALRDIFGNVNEVARLQRFFLDRRSFRSELVLGRIGVPDAAEVPEQVAGVEAAHLGPRWSASHVTLLRTSFVDGGSTFVEVAQIPLADSAEGLDARTGA